MKFILNVLIFSILSFQVFAQFPSNENNYYKIVFDEKDSITPIYAKTYSDVKKIARIVNKYRNSKCHELAYKCSRLESIVNSLESKNEGSVAEIKLLRGKVSLLEKELLREVSKEDKKRLSKLLEDAYNQIDSFTKTTNRINENYEQQEEELMKQHRKKMFEQEEEFIIEKMKYLKQLRELKPIELESISLFKFILNLKWGDALVVFTCFVGFFWIGYKYREHVFDKERIVLFTENLKLKQDLEKMKNENKRKYY